MREILFRGKRLANKKWVEGYLFIQFNTLTGKDDYYIRRGDTDYLVIPETVGQYTGKELDGEKLFTGDIVKTYEDYDDIFGYSAVNEFNSVVIWDDINFCFAFKTGDHIQSFNDWEWEYTTKIGNIHDNPELLGGEP